MLFKLKRTILLLLFSLSATLAAQANDALIIAWNGNVQPGQSSAVQMVKEVVYIKIFDERCYVRCKFWFYNHGNGETVKVGFPSAFYDQSSSGEFPVEQFNSIVNGEYIETNIMKEILFSDTLTNDKGLITRIDTLAYKEWHVKDVFFKERDTTIIEDSYWARWTSHPGEYHLGKTFRYTISTGATWFGNILDGTIIFDYSNYQTKYTLNNRYSYNTEAHDSLITDNHAVYKFRDLKPGKNSNFTIAFIDLDSVRFTDNDIVGERRNSFGGFIKEKNLSTTDVVFIKNEILAHRGYVFKDTVIYNYYKTMNWYKPNKKFSIDRDSIPLFEIVKQYCQLTPEQESALYRSKIEDAEARRQESYYKAFQDLFEIKDNMKVKVKIRNRIDNE